jgi:hypothetical protein
MKRKALGTRHKALVEGGRGRHKALGTSGRRKRKALGTRHKALVEGGRMKENPGSAEPQLGILGAGGAMAFEFH